MYTGTIGICHMRRDATAIRMKDSMAAFRGVNVSVSTPKTGRPSPLKIAKNPTRNVATPAAIPTSVPAGCAIEIAMRPARQPMK